MSFIQEYSNYCTSLDSKNWYRNGKRHRDGDRPAIEFRNGDKSWFQNDKLHRDGDRPAVVNANGDKWWYRHGILHRGGDRPAIENSNSKRWYQNDKLHRDGDRPAVEYIDGEKSWYLLGELHRDGDRPAIIEADGTKHWYKYGNKYSHKQITDYYLRLTHFAKCCLRKIRTQKLKKVRWIHGELLCKPPKNNFPGGRDYHKMVNYFNRL